ncbi:uncharacterized protein LOC133889590 [Phragmites australis]|uniref:uncharacterized protein LOC133889590 n=1 Tax=Phragmites australis TaxID=29695 RepID=UPI002D792A72|nr:uncharacterized protein LOC133889590 [Phragmites australis]
MYFLAALIKIVDLISQALRNAEKLPAALITSGIVEGVAALGLALFKAPGGIFQHHGKVPFFLYYGILIATVIFGFVEASAGFWVSGDLVGRRAVGKAIMWISILPIVLVAGLGGFVILK